MSDDLSIVIQDSTGLPIPWELLRRKNTECIRGIALVSRWNDVDDDNKSRPEVFDKSPKDLAGLGVAFIDELKDDVLLDTKALREFGAFFSKPVLHQYGIVYLNGSNTAITEYCQLPLRHLARKLPCAFLALLDTDQAGALFMEDHYLSGPYIDFKRAGGESFIAPLAKCKRTGAFLKWMIAKLSKSGSAVVITKLIRDYHREAINNMFVNHQEDVELGYVYYGHPETSLALTQYSDHKDRYIGKVGQ